MSQIYQIIVAEPDPQYHDIIGRELTHFSPHIKAYLCKAGTEAYQTAQSLVRLDLLITEALLPDIDGLNLAANLRQYRPGLKNIILSEYDLSDYSAYLADSAVLPKPFQPGQLQRTIMNLIPDLSRITPISQQEYPGTSLAYRSDVTQPLNIKVQQRIGSTHTTEPSQGTLPHPITPNLVQFQKVGEVSSTQESTGKLNLVPGMQVGSYLLAQKLPDTAWGTCFQAYQSGINRPTKIIFYQNFGYFTAQQFREYFTQLAAAPHPSLLTIIELGEHLGNPYVVEELWQGRSIAEFLSSQIQIDARQAAYLGEQAVGALAQISHLPCRLITPADILVNNKGIVKITHIYPLPGNLVVTSSAQLSALASILRDCLSESGRQEPRLTRLLDNMITGALSFEQAHRAFYNLQIELAPVLQNTTAQDAQEINERVERDQKAKKLAWLILVLTILSLTTLTLAFLYREEIIQWISPTGRDFSKEMQRIPAGVVQMEMQDPDDPDKLIVVPISTGEFWIDTYETTIYEYSLFLNAIKKGEVNLADITHPDTPERQRDFIPDDWSKILKAATSNAYYRDIKLSPNSPIFNVSFYDAYAYAKWKGKRLPTADEWLKAARGQQGYPYPWGKNPNDSAANTGLDYEPGTPEQGGKIDGFHGPGPVNDPRMEQDKSPFGVRLMFGNITEWTSTSGGISLAQNTYRIMGNSYTSRRPNPLSHRTASPITPSTRNAMTGFRLVSDNPPQKRAD